jgi:peptide/nickel transport system permease protein
MAIQLLRRTMTFIFVLWIASVVVFASLSLLPGDPAAVALGTGATEEGIAAMREEFGTDRPLPVQYASWISGLARGDFGVSYVSEEPIGPQILARMLVTLWLVGGGITAALIIAFPLGLAAAVNHQKVSGAMFSAVSQLGISIPNFVAGITLIALFSVALGWLPAGGWTPPSHGVGPFLRGILLPSLALGLVQGSILARYIRNSVINVQRDDFMRTARAKGLRPGQALVRHGIRNASIPVLTILGVQLSMLLIGTVVVERVFAIPGMGSLLLDGIANRDIVMVMGIVMVLVVGVLIINYVVDILYPVLDPRLRA